MKKMDRDAYRMKRASVIYQAFHLFPLLTVQENVMFPMELQHVPQKQAVARAMASGGEILLADEPTGNLDSQNEHVIVELLCKLAHEENYAVIIVTHNEAVASAADVVYGMSDGMLTVVRG